MSDPKTERLSAVKLAWLARQARAANNAGGVLAAEPIAVVGLGCRFPGGAVDPEAYWTLLDGGVDAIEEVPAERWDINALYDPDTGARGKMSTRWGAFLRDVERFDPAFFGIAPREAASMDPQQRLLLEVAWEALEDAGQTQASLAGSRTGVFFAVYNSDYAHDSFADRGAIDAYTSLGTAHAIASGRLSFLYDLQGPSLVVDTACSSSLVAIHLACQSLKNRECDLAVAGGASLILSPDVTISLSKWGFMAGNGRCKTFDRSADGFVRGEGCGVIALKRLADALADGDRILAVVRGSAVNQDGKSSVLTAPSGPAQVRAIRSALETGMVDAGEISYIEAHGTGTSLGDPIELEALGEVYGASGSAPCRVGSVKTNIGHLEAAAGVAGFIKVVQSLRHERIPPHLHFQSLNSHVTLEGTRLEVGAEGTPWPANGTPRLGAVSSFGFGGTNAHVVIEEAPIVPAPANAAAGPLLLPLSARSGGALREGAARMARQLAADLEDDGRARDICYTAALRRTHHEHRIAACGATVAGLVSALESYANGAPAWQVGAGHSSSALNRPGPVFVFSGQGPQWFAMGRELFEAEPVFRAALERCDAAFSAVSGWSIVAALQATESESRLGDTEVAQPAIFALQVSLAELWRSRGVTPSAVVGHSIGEVAAAHVSGALDLPSAALLVYHRSRLMQEATGKGRMAAVELAPDAASAAIDGHPGVSIAALNAPNSCVISGDTDAVERIAAVLAARGVSCRMLPVTYAFHSAQMAPIAARLEEAVRSISSRMPSIPMISTVSAEHVGDGSLSAAYWRRNVAQPVRFVEAIEVLLAAGHRAFIEIGPHPVLGGYLAHCASRHQGEPTIVASLRRGRPEPLSMAASLGALHAAGYDVDWAAWHGGRRRIFSLPTYAWQKQRYYIDRPLADRPAVAVDGFGSLLKGRVLRSAFASGELFEYQVSRSQPGFVREHVVGGAVVFPGMGIVLLAQDVGARLTGGAVDVTDLSIHEALPIGDGPCAIQVQASSDATGYRLDVAALPDASAQAWIKYASAHVGRAVSGGAETLDVHELRGRLSDVVNASDHYAAFEHRGVTFGPAFRGVDQIWRGPGVALVQITVPPSVAAEQAAYPVHPCLTDAGAQALWQAIGDAGASLTGTDAFLPVAIGAVSVLRPFDLATRLWAYAEVERQAEGASGATYLGRVTIADDHGAVIARLERVTLRRVAASALRRAIGTPDASLYHVDWRPLEEPARSSAMRDGAWIVLADRSGVADGVVDRLRAMGREAHVVRVAATGDTRKDGLILDPDDAIASRQGIAGLLGSGPVAGVLHCWNLDLDDAGVDLDAAWRRGAGSVLWTAQAILGSSATVPMYVLTSGAQEARRFVTAPRQSAVWGLLRSLCFEHPDLACVRMDLDPDDLDPAATTVAVLARVRSVELAMASGEVLTSRIVRLPAAPAKRAEPVTLDIAERGSLDRLALVPLARGPLAHDEVEIDVRASGLNFRDVLNALGMYQGKAGPLGSECAGVVTAVGAGVTTLTPGTRVLAVAYGSIGTGARTRAHLVTLVPAGMTFADAAAIPIAFLTAEYALTHKGALSRGDKVLIHAGTGGVGLAAIQVARRAGAEIFATAGSERKRAYLKALGVSAVFDSRSATFADEILARTGGRGVDVVLNSLTGDTIAASFRSVAEGGRFLEIGKAGIWTPEEVAAARPDITYDIVYMGDVFEQDVEFSRCMLSDLRAAFEEGVYQALPVRPYPLAQAADAFRYMAQARHIGKLVLVSPCGRPPAGAAHVRGDRSYLVTGGLGALGLSVASEIADRGGRHLVLAGRSAPSETASRTIAGLEAAGVSVQVIAADVSNRVDVERLVRAAETLAPLGGVVHAAGVVADAAAVAMDRARLDAVTAAKATSAWHLHEATRGRDIDFFVCFSSAASVLGSPGQTGYSAANGFLDGLAAYRHASGLPALSINWGPWADGGMAASMKHRDRDRLAAQGWQALSNDTGRRVFHALLAEPMPVVAVLPMDWTAYLAARPQAPDLLDAVATVPVTIQAEQAADTLDVMLAALPSARRREAVADHVKSQALRVLGLPADYALDGRQGLRDVGLDSLMAVELRNRLQASVGRVLSATLAFDFPTVETISAHLAELLGVEAAPRAPAPAVVVPAGIDTITSLSDEEAEALLGAELAAFDEQNKGR